ncbi:MAG TPA: GNAT family N-acetyltransferase [Gaiellaceae bacterium]|nr:GNAT family N-acetyltransferase [Gaiellaceae bacterium]
MTTGFTVRRAGPDDVDAVSTLYREFAVEVPPAPFDTLEKELGEVTEIVASETAFVAEDGDGTAVGFVLARQRAPGYGRVTDLYVAPAARRSGVATALMREVVSAFGEQGVEHVDVDVQVSNTVAHALYARWGLRDEVVVMTAALSDLTDRLGRTTVAGSFGSIHVQSDDITAVENAVRQFVPRLPGASRGSVVAPPRNGWIAVYDDVCDRDPKMLQRLARELSDRMGAVCVQLGVEREDAVRMIVFEHGRIVDEYLSLPEYYGPLPPGDVVGLEANPTVVARLTGADPAEVRRIARTAVSKDELLPPLELVSSLAQAMGIEGAEHGWSDAPELDGAVRIDRA